MSNNYYNRNRRNNNMNNIICRNYPNCRFGDRCHYRHPLQHIQPEHINNSDSIKMNYINNLINTERVDSNEKSNINDKKMKYFDDEKFNEVYLKIEDKILKIFGYDKKITLPKNNNFRRNTIKHKKRLLISKNKSKYLFIKSLTHKSYFIGLESEYFYNNERLEFIGDSHLNFLIKRYIFHRFSKYGNENLLSKISSYMISTEFYNILFNIIDLEDLVFIKNDVEITDNIREDIIESFIQALYCCVGIDFTKIFINKLLNEFDDNHILNNSIKITQILNEEVFKKYNKPMKEVIEYDIPPKHKIRKTYICKGFKINGRYYKNKMRITDTNKHQLLEKINHQIINIIRNSSE